MSKPIIEIQGIGKRYRIGATKERYLSLRDEVAKFASHIVKRGNRPSEEDFWALKNVSFNVQEGEVIGIIGRNGAGKSTLLKILSQITPPTEGQITVRGRVASLLEVGTGFHPELTGRENVYLNGTLLGMSRAEVARKFDEIVAFAEVEKFLDTPVKRYSSGMYVRLAFAVAAHLEPEILVVDEVLAVGDAEFQKKCLGKMGEVAKGGRTVLFVSHNMQAVKALCPRVVLLQNGCIAREGESEAVIAEYIGDQQEIESCHRAWNNGEEPGNDIFKLKSISLCDDRGTVRGTFITGERIRVRFEFDLFKLDPELCVGWSLSTQDGTIVLWSQQNDWPQVRRPRLHVGYNILESILPEGFLQGRRYYIDARISVHLSHWIVNMEKVLTFQTTLAHGTSEYLNAPARSGVGVVGLLLEWVSVDEKK
jgi:lipopolysaccharide transport system ATP-binding protein